MMQNDLHIIYYSMVNSVSLPKIHPFVSGSQSPGIILLGCGLTVVTRKEAQLLLCITFPDCSFMYFLGIRNGHQWRWSLWLEWQEPVLNWSLTGARRSKGGSWCLCATCWTCSMFEHLFRDMLRVDLHCATLLVHLQKQPIRKYRVKPTDKTYVY